VAVGAHGCRQDLFVTPKEFSADAELKFIT
jgi:hypothetical protein